MALCETTSPLRNILFKSFPIGVLCIRLSLTLIEVHQKFISREIHTKTLLIKSEFLIYYYTR